jgi:FMN phosphatase YigB (HAD superfamily)
MILIGIASPWLSDTLNYIGKQFFYNTVVMIKNKIQAVIFDMGGVLLRTDAPIRREAIAQRFGVTRGELEAFIFSGASSIQSEIGLISYEEHWQAVMRHFNQPIADYPVLSEEFFADDAIDQRLLRFAASLKPAYKLGLLSNAWQDVREVVGKKYDFLDVFDKTLFSYEVNARKPDPTIYHAILDLLDSDPNQAIFIDDMQENVDGAKAVGMHALRFTSTDAVIAALTARLQTG